MAFGMRFSPHRITATLLSDSAFNSGSVIEVC